MKRMTSNPRAALPLLLLAVALASCGGLNESRPAGTGNVSVYLTDAPSYAFDNVWVTVREIWFHKVETAAFDPSASGWTRFTLDNGVTVNLAALSGDNNVAKVFDNLALPAGTYRQMLLFLAPTESARMQSASDNGLVFNNQVDAGTLHAALRVPNAAQGIRVADRVLQVDNGALLRIAIDFDIGRDVLPFDRGAVKEFLLQPRPRSFDLDNAGAIVGFIDNTAASDNTALFEVLAEQVDSVAGFSAHVVRRTAAVDNTTGKFVLYPLVPGTIGVERYDIVIRGIGWRTAIVKGVPVTRGTTPDNATILGTAASPIPMTTGNDFRIAATISATSGALANFYQIIGEDPPYIIRQANFHPLSGTITDFPLASGEVGTDPFNATRYDGGSISFFPQPPTPAIGNYFLVAESPLFNHTPFPSNPNVSPSTIFSPVAVTGLSPAAPAVSTGILVAAAVPVSVIPLDNLVLFATFGGTILNAQPLGPVLVSQTLNNAITNLPGGSELPGSPPFLLAAYGASAYGWRTSIDNVLKIGEPVALAKPQIGPASVSFTMQNFPAP